MNKKIIALYLVTILCLISSVSMTIAWYVGNSNLYIRDFVISLNADKEIKIGTDEENFYVEIPSENINEVGAFIPVSSMYSSKWTNEHKDTPEFRQSYSSLSSESSQDSGLARSGFYSQEFYLYSESNLIATIADETSIVPNIEKNVATAKRIASSHPEYSQAEITKHLNGIVDSLRISILIPDEEIYGYYIIDPNKKDDEVTYFVGRLDNNADGYYDTSKGQERIFGEYENSELDKVVYTDVLTQDSDLYNTNEKASSFNAKSKKGTKAVNWEKTLENGFNRTIENSLTVSEAQSAIQIPIIGLKPQKVVISVYIEGWDLDNTDITKLGSFYTNIKFKVVR